MAGQPYFCSVASARALGGSTRAAAFNAARWEVDVLNIHFLDGEPGLQQRVLQAARDWTGPSMARLRFTNDPASPSDVRISFTPGLGSWSYLGTQAQQVHGAEPTMNFGWITPHSDQQTLRQVVLHEFGHAIGLVHEHQNPSGPIRWNIEAVLKDQSGPPNYWNRAQIQSNILDPYDPGQLSGTATDPHSIMMYPVPAHWTLDGFSVGWNTELSASDRQFIHAAYPW